MALYLPNASVMVRYCVALLTILVLTACAEQAERDASVPEQSIAELERPAPVVSGTDQEGKAFSSSSIRGSYWLASFMFTTCQTICPALNTVQADIARAYASRGLRFVSISTDPEHDTPAALKQYAQRYGAVSGTWWMLSMPIDTVLNVATRGFAVMGPEHPDMHSTRFVLVSPNQTIVDYFDSADTADVRRLRTTLDKLLPA
ncbi:MAG: SCO family protein [Candidatus Kapabacteria bacterium]|nr:SCO family protein [Candidatus Kapabacteria bacterium]